MTTGFPEWVEPMAATLTQERFTSPEWVFERKLDGIRLLAFKHAEDVRLLSRNRLLQNASYPAVVDAVRDLPVHDCILDGEATGVWGKPGKVTYHVFDVMWMDERDVTALTLDDRRKLLDALPVRTPLARVPRLRHEKPWERACSDGWEGVIAKRRDSRYEHRRSKHWMKMKCEASQELVIGGFTDPQGSRIGIGALLVGYYEDTNLVFAGKVGTGVGFDSRSLVELRRRLDALEQESPPFTKGIGLPRRAHWVRAEIVVQVAFTEWTVHGKLRHPRMLGTRIDKSAGAVVRETS